jgi:hypothetical protein
MSLLQAVRLKMKKKKQHKQYEKESFDARLQMEADAQRNVAARLKSVELQLKNQGRI